MLLLQLSVFDLGLELEHFLVQCLAGPVSAVSSAPTWLWFGCRLFPSHTHWWL